MADESTLNGIGHTSPCSALAVQIAKSEGRDVLISKQLEDIKDILQGKVTDFEHRIRKLEKWMWAVAGASGALGGSIGAIAAKLLTG